MADCFSPAVGVPAEAAVHASLLNTSTCGVSDPGVPAVAVVSCEGLATKHRFDPDGEGVSASGLRNRTRLISALRQRALVGIGFQMWTLTLDPWPFVEGGKPLGWEGFTDEAKADFYHGVKFQAAAKLAYETSISDRYVGEFMRSLRMEITAFEWVSCLEFQSNGMPHWHILILKAGRVRLDQSMIYRIWGRGSATFSQDILGGDHAIRYVTKYLVKGIDAPAWMDDSLVPRYMRFVTACRTDGEEKRNFWSAFPGVGDAAVGAPDTLEDIRLRRSRGFRMKRRVDPTLGEVRRNPERWRRTMLRAVIEDESGHRLIYRHLDMSLGTCVERMASAGFLGGGDEEGGRKLGHMSFSGGDFSAFMRLSGWRYRDEMHASGGVGVVTSGGLQVDIPANFQGKSPDVAGPASAVAVGWVSSLLVLSSHCGAGDSVGRFVGASGG